MYFSVVIPTYNRLDMLLRVLDALEAQVDAPAFETIVINDGSRDDTERVLSQRKGITFRTQANAGPGRARNHGVSLATGRFVIFIGDDTTDEAAFAVMPEFDGLAISVGRKVPGVSGRFQTPQDVRQWLERLVSEMAVAS